MDEAVLDNWEVNEPNSASKNVTPNIDTDIRNHPVSNETVQYSTCRTAPEHCNCSVLPVVSCTDICANHSNISSKEGSIDDIKDVGAGKDSDIHKESPRKHNDLNLSSSVLSPLSLPDETKSPSTTSTLIAGTKGSVTRTVSPKGTVCERVSKIFNTLHPNAAQKNGSSPTQTKNSRSFPIHCVIVRTSSENDRCLPNECLDDQIVLDTYAIVPGSTLFVNIVETSLFNLGYSSNEVSGAKGGIQLKNWKTLLFGSITEDVNATVEEILGEVTAVATLKIQLSRSQLKGSSTSDDVRDKLLQLLLTKSVDFLVQDGCPVEKPILEAISEGTISQSISDQLCALFKDWYQKQKEDSFLTSNVKDQSATDSSKLTSLTNTSHLFPDCKKDHNVISSENLSNPPTEDKDIMRYDYYDYTVSQKELTNEKFVSIKTEKNTQELYKISNKNIIQSNLHNYQSSQYLGLIPGKTRIRTSFDPEHEIPKLQKWFNDNQHPTREQMMRFMHELNILESRKGRRPLDLTNIIYWFKNARAAQRRATKALDDSFKSEENIDANSTESEQSSIESAKPCLSNKSDIYMVPFQVNPHFITNASVADGRCQIQDSSIDEPYDLSLTKRHSSEILQINSKTNLESFSSSQKPNMLQNENHKHSTINISSISPKFPALLDAASKMRQEISLTTGSSYFTNSVRSIGNNCDKERICFQRSESNDTEHSSKSDDTDSNMSNLATINSNRVIDVQNSINTTVKHENKEFEDCDSSKKCFEISSYASGGFCLSIDNMKKEKVDILNIKDEDDCTNVCYDSEEELRLKIDQKTVAAVADYAAAMHSRVSCLTAANMAALSLAHMAQPLHLPQLASSLALTYYPVDPRYYSQVTMPHFPSSPPLSLNVCHSSQLPQVSLRESDEDAFHIDSRSPLPSQHSMQQSVVHLNNQRQDSPQQQEQHPCNISETRKRRTRVFIDPLTEIPKLEKWFIEETHPSAFMIDRYCDDLNKCEYRQKFPKLEPKNIQLWFKNHRAKVKRVKVSCNEQEPHDMCSRQDDEEDDDVDN